MGDAPRPAAILATDIVGFLAVLRRDPQRARAVRERQLRLLRQFDGELVQGADDEVLAVFSSPVRAVDCGLALQAALRDADELRLRVGLHVGEVRTGADGVRGEALGAAGRICQFAEPGGIVASRALWEQVKQQGYLSGRAVGTRDVGSTEHPVELFEVALRGAPGPPRRPGR